MYSFRFRRAARNASGPAIALSAPKRDAATTSLRAPVRVRKRPRPKDAGEAEEEGPQARAAGHDSAEGSGAEARKGATPKSADAADANPLGSLLDTYGSESEEGEGEGEGEGKGEGKGKGDGEAEGKEGKDGKDVA